VAAGSGLGPGSLGGVLEAPVPEKSGLVKKMSPFSKPEKTLSKAPISGAKWECFERGAL